MKLLFCSAAIIIFLGCSNSTDQSYRSQRSASSCPLPDSLFAFRNISSSLVAEHFYYDTNNSCYTDSSKKIKLVLLSDTQKKQFIDSIAPYSNEWIMGDWQMH